MERTLKEIAYLLAVLASNNTGDSPDTMLAKAANYADKCGVSAPIQVALQSPEDDIEIVYKAYPTKCPINGRSTGKCHKDKLSIGRILKTHSRDELVTLINNYVADCVNTNSYIKNFATFLNQLPDVTENDSLFTGHQEEPTNSYYR